MDDIYHPRQLLEAELTLRQQQGYDDAQLAAIRAALNDASGPAEVEALWRQTETLPPPSDWPYHEPNSLDAIQSSLPKTPLRWEIDSADVADRIYGGVLGRCIGCMLGKPLEGIWDPAAIRRYLTAADAYPLDGYVPLVEPFPPDLPHFPWARWAETTRGNIEKVVVDDDIEYLILASLIMEAAGRDFGMGDVADAWLSKLAYRQIFTAERVAYRNLVNDVPLEKAAAYRNPYREWIGAQIRADGYGFASPGDPWAAARRAWHDAALTHTRNGVYGALWVASMIAAAFVLDDPAAIVEAGLSVVPPRSRFADAIRRVQGWANAERSWEAVHQRIEAEIGTAYGVDEGLNAIHTIPNACIVAMALLMGEGDFERSITTAVMGGYDTDCNGATVGAVVGVMGGPERIPGQWSSPLNDTIESNLPGQNGLRITELAARFAALV